jgi:RHS repeat-associated protein
MIMMKKQWLLTYCLFLITACAFAAEEPYMNELRGADLKAGSFLTVSDEKFNIPSAWSKIDQHISVDDIVSFEINFDSTVYFYNQPFTCTLNFKIYIYGNAADTSLITDSVTHSDISLDVRYDTASGKPYKGIALYKFKNAHKFRIMVISITSPQLSPLLPIFRVKSQVIVNRQYTFNDNSTDKTRYSLINGNQVRLDWSPSLYPGAEMFDVEYTFIDKQSQTAASIAGFLSGGQYNIPADTLAKWFRNNGTRITTASASYMVNALYDSGYILFRVRGAQMHYPDNIRWEGNWNYLAREASAADCGGSCGVGVVWLDGHEQNLNWQATVSFAEEGKRKEVISYFDGSLRNRQSVTLNNSDNKSVVQETIYDALGRAAASILPAPTMDSTLHYFRGFNKSSITGNPYSFADLLYACNTTANPIDQNTGASKYYSENNPFLATSYHARYTPHADGYPLAVTDYVGDNTGRIRAQGGVGPIFQLGTGKETKYFYGKPTQTELDRLFGLEAGAASHYLKNMVVDANGQISVSYVDASGRTIATALAGNTPPALQSLPSNNEQTSVRVSNELLTPGDFRVNTNDYSLTASATFLAPVTGDYKFKYRIDPMQYSKLYGPGLDTAICSNCYYDLEVLVKDECDNLLSQGTVSAGNLFDTTCAPLPQAIIDSLTVTIPQIGEYYVTYNLRVSRDALNYFDSVHLVRNSDIQPLNYFLREELKNTDFSGCFNNCETCKEDLGEKADFLVRFKSLFIADSLPFMAADSVWVSSLYDSLYAHCQAIQVNCGKNVCDEKLALLKMDVSPGGQYALFDASYNLQERTINRLDTAWRKKIAFFTDENGIRDSVMLFTREGADSLKVDVRNLPDSLFIQYWNDSWADSLVKLHPEYCYYLWCVANSTSYEFDREIGNWEDADTAIAKGWFSPLDYKAIVDVDPFFMSGGNGAHLRDRMMDSLRLYSRHTLGLAKSDKNILEYIDVMLYCGKNQSNAWESCIIDSACRSRNREWFLYKNFYLTLKQRFYEEARRTSSDSVFANCVNCYIGKDLLQDINGECKELAAMEDEYKKIRLEKQTGQAWGGFRLTSMKDEIIEGVNGLLEWRRRASTGRTLSPRYSYRGYNAWQMGHPIYSIAHQPFSGADSTFSMTLGVNAEHYLQLSTQWLSLKSSFLANQQPQPSDFAGAVSSLDLAKRYLGTTLMDEWGRFRLMWGGLTEVDYNAGCVPWLAGYYGLNPAHPKYYVPAPCAMMNQGYIVFSFYKMPTVNPTLAEYVAYRPTIATAIFQTSGNPSDDDRLPAFTLRDSLKTSPRIYQHENIRKVLDFHLDTALLKQFTSITNYYPDTTGMRYMRAKLLLMNDSIVDAYIFDNTFFRFKNFIDTTILGNDCQKGFAAYYNSKKGTNYTFAQLDSIYQRTCGKSLNVCDTTPPVIPPLFRDTTCNYTCPAGAYTPYDRPGVSLYIEYGTPGTSPVSVPGTYGNCRFYPIFDLQTGATTTCRFFNVWVCESPAGTPGIKLPSYCPGTDYYADLYANKIRRYAEYTDPEDFMNDDAMSNPQIGQEEGEETVKRECESNCEAQADIWIKTLSTCTTDPVKLAQLKAALIDICSKGCSMDSPFGTSSIPASIPATYHSFEEAIIGILGAAAINDSCAAELIAQPYPYDQQPVLIEELIMETNYEICNKIGTYRKKWQTSGSALSFHNWLRANYPDAYKLEPEELEDLLNSCLKCNGILDNDIVLPVLFDPASGPCLTCDVAQTALTAFNAKFPGITIESANYELLFANFFNHRFGYSLTYQQYRRFLDSCANPSYQLTLCNQPATEEYTASQDNACMAELFATALTNATSIYITYIDSVRRDFRDAWMTKCLNVQPRLNMTADLYEYHYTLYYYDQSGNLVKTVPPEGVDLLTDEMIANLQVFRKNTDQYCSNNNSLQFTGGYLALPGANVTGGQYNVGSSMFTVEAWINPADYQRLNIISDVREGLGNPINVKGYTLTFTDTAIRFFLGDGLFYRLRGEVKNVSRFIPLNTWSHIVVQRVNDTTLKFFVNGTELPVSYIARNAPGGTDLSRTDFTPLYIGANGYGSVNPTTNSKLRHVRVYKRALSAAEIRQNYFDYCGNPANTNGLLLWVPMTEGRWGTVSGSPALSERIAHHNILASGSVSFEHLEDPFLQPQHRLVTTYQHNSLNAVNRQKSPDGGTFEFFHDRLGRVIVSQNEEQKDNLSPYSGQANRFSYTSYDRLGRIIEVGEKDDASGDIRSINRLDTTAVKNWLASGNNWQVSRTIYDEPVNLALQNFGNSRKRVTASIFLERSSDTQGDSTIYSYDINGYVKTLVQHVKALVAVDEANGRKRIDYNYDLVSGKVNRLDYQAGKGDQFFYKYGYDSENRLTNSYTSRDKLLWTEESSYQYYLHGPLARTELGHYKVQGVDYAYTLEGWLKGINGSELNSAKDIGNDGLKPSPYARVSRDVYAYTLGYHLSDYMAIGGPAANALQRSYYPTDPVSAENSGNESFNGNVNNITVALSKINSGEIAGYTYGYDQLNRVVAMDHHQIPNVFNTWSRSNISSMYKERIAYDANGNILKYLRDGYLPQAMDSLSYKYNRDINGRLLNNKLNHVRDAVAAGNYADDIDNQSSNTYTYDKIGNLKTDYSELIINIDWTVYGKIRHIAKLTTGQPTILYGYDPAGNRTWKSVSVNGNTDNSYYIRDAQGNTMAVYSKHNTEPVKWNEQHLYGSSRLGMWNWDTLVQAVAPVVGTGDHLYDSLRLGARQYELTNHLGNVLSVISDKKVGNDSSGSVNYYIAEVLSQKDYYPFGMGMPGRTFDVNVPYRYGFNGKENDNDVKGEGNQQDYGMRIYDPRLGKFLSVDPLSKLFPWNSPYAYCEGDPVNFIDLDGLEKMAEQGQATLGTKTGTAVGSATTRSIITTTVEKGSEMAVDQTGRLVAQESSNGFIVRQPSPSWVGRILKRGSLLFGFLLSSLEAGHSCPCGRGHDLSNQCPKSYNYKDPFQSPKPEPQAQPKPDPRTVKPLDEDGNEGAHLYKTLDNQKNTGKGGRAIVANKMNKPIPYVGITVDKVIGGRYSLSSLRGFNSEIIGTSEFSTIAGAETAIIALNTYGLGYKGHLSNLIDEDAYNSTRVGNLRFSYKNPIWIANGIIWLNKNRPGWDQPGSPNSLLFKENKKGKKNRDYVPPSN